MNRYAALVDDRSRCRRCRRRTQLFGSRDIETGWEGWCRVCNAEWAWQRSESACSHCNRLWYTSSPFLLALGLNLNASLVICVFLGDEYHLFSPHFLCCVTSWLQPRSLLTRHPRSRRAFSATMDPETRRKSRPERKESLPREGVSCEQASWLQPTSPHHKKKGERGC